MDSTDPPRTGPPEAHHDPAPAATPVEAEPESTPPEAGEPEGGGSPSTGMSPLEALAAGLLVPALVSAVILLLIGPRLLFLDTTPTGFDLGGHVYPLYQAVERIPGRGLPGWSDGWFGGFPLYYFYFPFPAVLVWVVGLVAPFTVAVKLVSVSGVVTLPFAAYFLARSIGFSRFVSSACVLGSGAFVFMQSYFYLGGNLSSTLAGEFSYGIAFTLSLVYLGIVARTARGGPNLGVFGALVLAATALSHVLPTAVVVVASLPLLTIRRSQRPVFVSWVLGFLLSGFWAVPFLLRSGLLPHVPWVHVHTVADMLPKEIWLLLPFAVGGAVLTLGKRWAAVPLLVPPILGVAFYWFAGGAVHPGRLLPYWFFAVHFLAAAFTGGALLTYARKRAPAALAGGLLGVAAFAVTSGVRQYGDLHTWAAWNYSGYEAKPGWPALSAMVDAFEQLPPGRVHWEDNRVIASYGSLNALTLLPYWSPSHPTVGGLWLESSLTAPAWLWTRRETSFEEVSRSDPTIPPSVGLDMETGVVHMRLLGARYYVAFSDQAVSAARSSPDLTVVASTDAFTIFELPSTALVEVNGTPPLVSDVGDFQAAARTWFSRPAGFGRWLVADGPGAWPRSSVDGSVEATQRPFGWTGDPDPVSDLAISDRDITFTTAAVGVPHLIKASWFPNWRAEGALGPYLAAPSWMVVIPNRESVHLRFRHGWAEWLGAFLSVVGVLGLVSGLLHVGVMWAFLSGEGSRGAAPGSEGG